MKSVADVVHDLQSLGYYAEKIGEDPYITIRGAYRLEHFETGPKIKYEEDSFGISQEGKGEYWETRFSGPGMNFTIIRRSKNLEDALSAVLGFFRVKATADIETSAILATLYRLQLAGLHVSMNALGEIEISRSVFESAVPSREDAPLMARITLTGRLWTLVSANSPDQSRTVETDDPITVCSEVLAFINDTNES